MEDGWNWKCWFPILKYWFPKAIGNQYLLLGNQKGTTIFIPGSGQIFEESRRPNKWRPRRVLQFEDRPVLSAIKSSFDQTYPSRDTHNRPLAVLRFSEVILQIPRANGTFQCDSTPASSKQLVIIPSEIGRVRRASRTSGSKISSYASHFKPISDT